MGKATLTDEQRAEILARKGADPTVTHQALADEFGVNKSTITRVLETGQKTAERSEPLFRLVDIRPSPLNPRKTFDQEGLEQLAASIHAQGLLQNLVIRDAGDGAYQIVAGERRYRALNILADRGDWDRNAAIVPARLVAASDGEHLAIALLENLQRKDVNPMEEAEAFSQLQALDPEKWSPQSIAEAIGMTTRHVQLRLALAHKLSDEMKAQLREGKITLAHARILAPLPHSLQKKHSWNLERATANDLAARIKSDLIPVDTAHFDIAKYKGEIIEDDDGARYFASRSEFKKAQAKSAKDLANAYKGKGVWAFVTVIEAWSDQLPWTHESKDAPESGVLIMITRSGEGAIVVHEGVVEKQQSASNANRDWETENAAKKRQQSRMHEIATPFISQITEVVRNSPAVALQLALYDYLAIPTPYFRATILRANGGLREKHFAEGAPLSTFAGFMGEPGQFGSQNPDFVYYNGPKFPADLWAAVSVKGDPLDAVTKLIAARLQIDLTEPLPPPYFAIARDHGIDIPEELLWSEIKRDSEIKKIEEAIRAEGNVSEAAE